MNDVCELTDDCLSTIFKFLNVREAVRLNAVSTRWRKIDGRDNVWLALGHSLFERQYGSSSSSRPLKRRRRRSARLKRSGKDMLIAQIAGRRRRTAIAQVEIDSLIQRNKLTFASLRSVLREWEPVEIDLRDGSSYPLFLTIAARVRTWRVKRRCLKYLIDRFGADPNASNHYGYTALMQEACMGNKAGVEFLLRHGADPSSRGASPHGFNRAKDRRGRCVGPRLPSFKGEHNALEWAVLYGHGRSMEGVFRRYSIV